MKCPYRKGNVQLKDKSKWQLHFAKCHPKECAEIAIIWYGLDEMIRILFKEISRSGITLDKFANDLVALKLTSEYFTKENMLKIMLNKDFQEGFKASSLFIVNKGKVKNQFIEGLK